MFSLLARKEKVIIKYQRSILDMLRAGCILSLVIDTKVGPFRVLIIGQ